MSQNDVYILYIVSWKVFWNRRIMWILLFTVINFSQTILFFTCYWNSASGYVSPSRLTSVHSITRPLFTRCIVIVVHVFIISYSSVLIKLFIVLINSHSKEREIEIFSKFVEHKVWKKWENYSSFQSVMKIYIIMN